MKILPQYKVRHVVDDDVLMIQGKDAGDMTRVIALNETSLYLWNELKERAFELDDVVALLTGRYEVEEATARKDAQQWVSTLAEHGVIAR